MGTFGPLEIVGIIVVVVLLFGAKKIPELARGVGEGMKELRKAMKDDEDQESQE